MPLNLIRHTDLTVSPWRNGAGRKADIASGPGWLVGFAWLDHDAPFSDYAGHDRTITLLEGPGFALDFEGGSSLQVTRHHAPAAFDGGVPTKCRILGGPCVVLNAMTQRATHAHTVTVKNAAEMAMANTAGAEALIIVLLTGSAAVSTMTATTHLSPRDAVEITGPATLRARNSSLVCVVTIRSA